MNCVRFWETPAAFGRIVMAAGVCLAALVASGCMSSGPEPNTVRNVSQTAPADLQLTCATAAATSFGVESTSILPVSSSPIDAQRYQVELNVKGSKANCVVDTAGNVLSVEKV